MTNTAGYLYIIHVREFIRSREPIFKVGRTDNISRRLSQYPKGSKLIATVAVDDMVRCETRLLSRLCSTCMIRVDLGREYVQGCLKTISKIMNEVAESSIEAYDASCCLEHGESQTMDITEDPLNTKNPSDSDKTHLKQDPQLCVVSFIRSRKDELSKNTVASLWLYQEYQAYIQDTNNGDCYVSHNRFTNVLKNHFGVVAKPLRLPDHGLCQALVFQDFHVKRATNTECLTNPNPRNPYQCFIDEMLEKIPVEEMHLSIQEYRRLHETRGYKFRNVTQKEIKDCFTRFLHDHSDEFSDFSYVRKDLMKFCTAKMGKRSPWQSDNPSRKNIYTGWRINPRPVDHAVTDQHLQSESLKK